MKTNFITLFMILGFSMVCSAQTLANTKWSGEVNIPNKEAIVLEFRNVAASISVKGDVVEYMWYKQDGNKLVLAKYWGGSPCKADEHIEAHVTFEMTKDRLVFHVAEDKCAQRGKSFDGLVFTRIK